MSRTVMGREDLLEEARQVYYNVEFNRFVDEGGYVISNIHRLLSPNVVYMLKHKQEDMFVFGVNGEFVELIYEDYEDYEMVYGDYELPIDRR